MKYRPLRDNECPNADKGDQVKWPRGGWLLTCLCGEHTLGQIRETDPDALYRRPVAGKRRQPAKGAKP